MRAFLRLSAVVVCFLALAGTAALAASPDTGVAAPPPAPDTSTAPPPGGVRETAPAAGTATGSVNTAQLMVPGRLVEKTLGDVKAPVTVVEYASMTCPHCARFANETFEAFKAKYIDTGKAFFVFREFPLDQLALVAVMAARCAPDEKFFPIVARLFREQEAWAFVDNPGPALLDRLKQEGFTDETFRACVSDTKLVEGIIDVEKRAEETFGVNGTPTFFFNGEKHVGELTIAQADALMEPLLKPTE